MVVMLAAYEWWWKKGSLHDTLAIIVYLRDDVPKSMLKNGSLSPQNGPPHGTTT